MSEPLISIAIPVRDAGDRLHRTLCSIAGSTDVDLARVQVVLVDDGSSDDAVTSVRPDDWPFATSIVQGDWGSQSAATNAAIAASRGRYVLLSAQDIRFEPGMLRAHLDVHARHDGEGPGVAVLGELPYAPEADTTPFTFYLVNGGFQFAYFLISDPGHVPPNFFYAPNVSLRREALDRVGGFDEMFPYGLQDTDLGIRLAAAGVRLVHEPSAVGLHDHPTTLDAFRGRMARIAPLRLLLEEKHPFHEPSIPSWDLVVSGCLAYDALRLELDLALVERLEPVVAARAEYRELWRRQLAGTLAAVPLGTEDRRTLELTDRLFAAYGRILQAGWAGAYLEAAIERHGREHVESILHARLVRLQAPRPAYRVVEAALREHGLAPAGLAAPHAASVRVVHGIASREAALEVVDRFTPPSAGAVDQELVLLLEPGACDDPTREALARSATVIEAGPLEGLARVAREIDAPMMIVTEATTTIDELRAVPLARTVLDRIPSAAALGGAVEGDDRPAAPIDTPAAALVVLRRETASRLDGGEPASIDERWTVTLGRVARDGGGMVLHVPDLVARGERHAVAVATR